MAMKTANTGCSCFCLDFSAGSAGFCASFSQPQLVTDCIGEQSKLEASDFRLERHAAYFKKHLQELPGIYKTMDTNRLTLLYFCVSGLDLLDLLGEVDKVTVIRYIYSQQSSLPDHGGFYGYPRLHFDSEEQDRCNNQPHIANTYVALAMLIILDDDLQRVNRQAVAASLQKWQLPDGSFCCVHGISSLDSENDMRFVYCAACICYMLDLWSAVDVERMAQFILSSQSYDSAFGMGPLTESHGGCTYCALASLAMMGRLNNLPSKEAVIDWCIKRQHLGFQGRIEKPMDSCYSFWVGGSLSLLGVGHLLDGPSCARFLKSCESAALGGFQKFPEVKMPDLLHSYFSVCGLSLCGLLQPMNPLLNMSKRAFDGAAAGFQTPPDCLPWRQHSITNQQKEDDAPLPFGSAQGAQGAQGSRDTQGAKVAQGAWLALLAAVLFPVLLGLLALLSERVSTM
mmetsp:Transcript_128191/g.256015  ORF Transcript_128191/g.256015 Transcript_128191/m.256015 type:complete len:455 (+) Transcript_128191:174-1538(+)